jgi:O-antigen biosynthesis protein
MGDTTDIIIPVHGRADLLSACLTSLARGDGKFIETTYVVDDASPPAEKRDLRAAAAGHPLHIEWLILEHRSGFVGAANAGWKTASGPVAVVLNNDVAVGPNTITTLCDTLSRESDVAAVGPTSDNPRDLFQYRRTAVLRAAAAPASYLTAMCLAIRRSAIGEVPFDSVYAPGYFEDLDLSCRLRTTGWRLSIAENAAVHHIGAATYSACAGLSALMERNYATFAARWNFLPTHGTLERALHLAGRMNRSGL